MGEEDWSQDDVKSNTYALYFRITDKALSVFDNVLQMPRQSFHHFGKFAEKGGKSHPQLPWYGTVSTIGLQTESPTYINNEFNTSDNERRNSRAMPYTYGEGCQVLIQDLQKSVDLSRASSETTALTMHAIKILNPGNQRLWGDLSAGIECLTLLGGEGLDMPLDCQGKCRVRSNNYWDCVGANRDREGADGDGKCPHRRSNNNGVLANRTIVLSAQAIYRTAKQGYKYLLFGEAGWLGVGLDDLEPARLLPIPRKPRNPEGTFPSASPS